MTTSDNLLLFTKKQVRYPVVCRRSTFAPQRIPMVRSILQSNSALTASILLSFLCFTHSFCEAASGSQCFFSSGLTADRNLPCNPTETESFCCGIEWTCLPNRLCASGVPDGKEIKFARGACTAKSWTSTSGCPNFCLETPS